MTLEAANPSLRVDEKIISSDLEDLNKRLASGELKLKIVKRFSKFILAHASSDLLFNRYMLLVDDTIIGEVKLEPTQFKFLVTPHSVLAKAHRGQGLMPQVYDWLLNKGYCFGSGEAQSKGANVLWSKLAKRHPWFLVNVKGSSDFVGFGSIQFIGQSASKSVLNSTNTRIIMLGRGWDLDKFQKKTGMKMNTVSAKTFRTNTESEKAASQLCQDLNAYGEYTVNDIDKTIVTSCDVHEAQANLQALGYRPVNITQYETSPEVGKARFLTYKSRLVMLRADRNGWSSRIVVLGTMPRFDLVAEALAAHTKGYPVLGVYNPEPGVFGLSMKITFANGDANSSMADSALANIGFRRSGAVYKNRTLDMTATYTGNVITFLDQ